MLADPLLSGFSANNHSCLQLRGQRLCPAWKTVFHDTQGSFLMEMCRLLWRVQGLVTVSGLLGYGHTFLERKSLGILCVAALPGLGSSLAAATALGCEGQALTS